MSAAEAQSEPTMEEILASIRKIISEDDVKPEEPANEDVAAFDDVLELSAPIEEPALETNVSPDFDFDALGFDDEPATDFAPEPEAQEIVSFDEPMTNSSFDEEYENDDVIAIDIEPDPVFEEPEPVAYEPPAYEPPKTASFDPPPAPPPLYQEQKYEPRRVPPHLAETIGLIGDDAANAASDAFAKLGNSLPGHFANGVSVEELVSYLLKPMLKNWLDTNLPRIVEERVEAELARIARRGF